MRQSWRLACFCGLIAALVALSPMESFGQKNPKKKDKGKVDEGYPATPADYKGIQKAKDLLGSILTIDSGGLSLTVRAETSHVEANPNYKPPQPPKGVSPQVYAANNPQYAMWRTWQDLQQQQRLAMQAKTPDQMQKALFRVQMDMAKFQQQQMMAMAKASAAYAKGAPKPNDNPANQPFITVKTYKDYSLDIQDSVVVRKMFLPLEYDDTGNIKKYTDKEKEELKGKDKTKPGYSAKLEDLTAGQDVKLYLTPPKVKKKEDKEKDEPDVVEHPTVNMIVMTKDMGASSVEGAPGQKDKKKKQ